MFIKWTSCCSRCEAPLSPCIKTYEKENKKFIKEIFKSGAFYDVDMSDFATEYGVCEVFKKQF